MRRLLLKLVRRKRLQQDLAAELAFHAEMSRQHQNAIRLGNVSLVKEQALDLWRFNLIENFWRDLTYGMRGLRRSPALLICALLSLGLGIGANTSIFELLDALRLRTLPVSKPNELAEVRIVGGHGGMGVNPGEYPELSRPVWEEIERRQEGFSGMFAWTADAANIGHSTGLHRVKAMWVSGGFFRVLGVQPFQGRLLLPEDIGACPETIAVVSYPYWQSKMGARPLNSSTTLQVDGDCKQIVGVMPPGFVGLSIGDRFEIILPLCRPKELRSDVFDIAVMGRLRPGWTLKQASDQLAAISPDIFNDTAPRARTVESTETYKKFRLGAFSAAQGVSVLRGQYDNALLLLLAITGLVLLIACANLANLLLARATTREREMAVRLALGASRNRLLRQLAAEGALLAGTGAVIGIAVAQIFTRLLVSALSTEGNAVVLPLATDWRVLSFTALVSALTCMIFALLPAKRAITLDPVSAMKSTARGATGGYERHLIQRLLVLSQIAISLVLLIAAFLFIRSFRNLLTFNPGMREADITVAFIAFQKSHVFPDLNKNFTARLVEEVRSIPGVLNAASTTNIPLFGGSWEHDIQIGPIKGISKFTWVSPQYFETMGIPLMMGRGFGQRDTAHSQHVAIVNETFVRRYLGNANPLGRTLRTEPEPDYPATLYQIIGVIPDTKYNELRGDTPPMTFAPGSQFPEDTGPFAALLIYSKAPAAQVASTVKRVIAEKHPEVAAVAGDFEAGIRDGMVRDRVLAVLAGIFGLLAALLAMIGLYGVISYLVVNRRPEIGVRMALGASRWQVVGMIMKEACELLLIGALIGTVLALIAGRSASSFLFDLKPYDPLTLVSAVLLLAFISALASYLPARRASKLDPTAALRYE
jgi:predicted permease